METDESIRKKHHMVQLFATIGIFSSIAYWLTYDRFERLFRSLEEL